MDRMLVVVFDNETKAYEGQRALLQLANEGSISVYGYAVLGRNADGTTTLKQGDETGPLGTLAGTALGALIGVLGGPVGMAVGAATGAITGSVLEVDNARVGYDYIDDVSQELRPNRVAVVAEIEEDWTTPVDTRMEAIGGRVHRRALSEVTEAMDTKEIDAMKLDVAQLKAEHAKAKADRQLKLNEKLENLESKIRAHIQRNTDRRQALEREARAKAQVLKEKAANTRARAS